MKWRNNNMPCLSFRTRSGWMDSTQLIKGWHGHWLSISFDLLFKLLKNVQKQRTQTLPTKVMMIHLKIWYAEIQNKLWNLLAGYLSMPNHKTQTIMFSPSLISLHLWQNLWTPCKWDGRPHLDPSPSSIRAPATSGQPPTISLVGGEKMLKLEKLSNLQGVL